MPLTRDVSYIVANYLTVDMAKKIAEEIKQLPYPKICREDAMSCVMQGFAWADALFQVQLTLHVTMDEKNKKWV